MTRLMINLHHGRLYPAMGRGPVVTVVGKAAWIARTAAPPTASYLVASLMLPPLNNLREQRMQPHLNGLRGQPGQQRPCPRSLRLWNFRNGWRGSSTASPGPRSTSTAVTCTAMRGSWCGSPTDIPSRMGCITWWSRLCGNDDSCIHHEYRFGARDDRP